MSAAIIITADDYAQFGAVDDGILQLVAAGRVSAFSCLASSPRWPEAARRITPAVTARADVGLHWDLTDDVQVSRSHARLVARAMLGRLDAASVRKTLHQQLDRFAAAVGRMPDYVDGHRHVQQLPTARDVLVSVIAERRGEWRQPPWLRVSDCRLGGLKGQVITHTGAAQLRRMAHDHGLLTNGALFGSYPFSWSRDRYRAHLQQWLELAQPGDALMCHPAAAADPTDAIGAARVVEFAELGRLTVPVRRGPLWQ